MQEIIGIGSIKMSKRLIAKILFLLAIGALVHTGCAKDDSTEGYGGYSIEGYGSDTSREVTTRYCLGCHNSTYQAFADSTVALRGEDNWLNPHRSAHGTNIPCRTCHEENTNGEETNCADQTVKRAVTCANFCHAQDTLTNPYPNYKSSGPLSGVGL